MEPVFSVWDIIHLLGAAQGFFLAFLFLFLKRGNPLANRFLGLLLFIFSLRLLSIIAFWTKYLLIFPHFSLVAFPFSYLIGVSFYFYTWYLTTGSEKFERKNWLHIVPFLIVFCYMVPYYLLSADLKLQVIKNTFYPETPGVSEIQPFRLLMITLQFPHALFYVFLALRHLRQHKAPMVATNGKPRLDKHTWLRYLAFGFGGFFGAWLLYNLSFILGNSYSKFVDLFLTSAMTVFIYAIGYAAFQRPELHNEIVAEPRPKYQTSTLTTDQTKSYLRQLQQLMEVEKLHKESELKLADLAEKLDISPNHLSQVINEALGQNFFDFVNQYRIEEAKQLLADGSSKQYTLLSIAYEVGFNNKTSFNNFFKKFTGMTPSQFRAKMNQEKPS